MIGFKFKTASPLTACVACEVHITPIVAKKQTKTNVNKVNARYVFILYPYLNNALLGCMLIVYLHKKDNATIYLNV